MIVQTLQGHVHGVPGALGHRAHDGTPGVASRMDKIQLDLFAVVDVQQVNPVGILVDVLLVIMDILVAVETLGRLFNVPFSVDPVSPTWPGQNERLVGVGKVHDEVRVERINAHLEDLGRTDS